MTPGAEATIASMERLIVVQEITAQNVANVETAGFKRSTPFFASFVETADTDTASDTVEPSARPGQWVDFSPGPLMQTANDLDVAIRGNGFFVLRGPEGERYTRSGNFRLAENGLLVTQDGIPVLGDMNEIQIPGDAATIHVDSDGNIYADNTKVDRVRIASFEDPAQLTPLGGCQFVAGPDVRRRDPESYTIVQGSLERSNVSPIGELVTMIATLRMYEASAKALRAIEDSASELYDWAGQQ